MLEVTVFQNQMLFDHIHIVNNRASGDVYCSLALLCPIHSISGELGNNKFVRIMVVEIDSHSILSCHCFVCESRVFWEDITLYPPHCQSMVSQFLLKTWYKQQHSYDTLKEVVWHNMSIVAHKSQKHDNCRKLCVHNMRNLYRIRAQPSVISSISFLIFIVFFPLKEATRCLELRGASVYLGDVLNEWVFDPKLVLT